jgi:HD-GYP domain-containing protein (c-di-GMP phosphodiesterase class II)
MKNIESCEDLKPELPSSRIGRMRGKRSGIDARRRRQVADDLNFADIGLEVLKSLDYVSYDHSVAMGGLFACLLETALDQKGAMFDAADRRFLSAMDFKEKAVIGAMHDLGKRRIPAEIVGKNGPLDDREKAIMAGHAEHGADESLAAFAQGGHGLRFGMQLRFVQEIARGHHAPAASPLAASPLVRLAAIADVSDALVQKRPYKAAMPVDSVRDILKSNTERGSLDKELVDMTFESWDMISKLLILRGSGTAGASPSAYLKEAENISLNARIEAARGKPAVEEAFISGLLLLYSAKQFTR